MGRYKRKTERQTWSSENMRRAIDALRAKGMGLKKACREFNVPRSTLQRRYKRACSAEAAASKGLGSKDNVFNDELEAELVEHVKTMERMLFGFTPKRFRQLAYQLAEVNNVHHRFNMQKKEAGKDWYRAFMSRHQDLSLRMPESTSAARAQSFNKVVVSKFFDLLEELQNKFNFTPERIYNVDETGITTVPNRPSKVLASKGKKQVGALSSAERGKLVTVEICMNAAGNFVPPFFVFPRCRMKADLLDSAPPGSQAAAHPSGWMQTEIFQQWFDHFLQQTHPTAEAPVLLILDGHKTHTSNLEVINKARDQHVSILCLPPHCSHRLQPLDVTLMKPLSTFYSQEVEKWLLNHPGRVVTVDKLPLLFGAAYLRAASALTAVNGFKNTGIWPINRDVFTEADFSASVPTDIPLNSEDDVATSTAQCNVVSVDSVATTSTAHFGVVSEYVVQSAEPDNQRVPGQPDEPVVDKESRNAEQDTVHVLDISPLPKATHRSNRKGGRARGKTAVLTSSPYKKELMLKKQEMQNVSLSKNRKADAKKKAVDPAELVTGPPRKKRLRPVETGVTRKKKLTCREDKRKGRPRKMPQEKTSLQFDKKTRCSLLKKTVNKTRSVVDDKLVCFCGETFVEPPTEPWIQCNNCAGWFHEACTAGEGQDGFTCDNCL